jgi:squalene-hopene/tetraprenyl-beta-curcumene cyclase
MIRPAARDGTRTGPGGQAPTDESELSSRIRRALAATRLFLLSKQKPDGHWVAELEGDSILQSETILLLAFLGRLRTKRAHSIGRRLLDQQRPEGGWAIYPGGPVDPSATVKAYFALKLLGYDQKCAEMTAAREAALAAGGADAVNSFTRFYLALLGQIPYSACPVVPPELLFIPQRIPFSLGSVSAWSRTMIVPLSIMSALKPVVQVEESRGIRELFIRPPEEWPATCRPIPRHDRWGRCWAWLFRAANRVLHEYERLPWKPFRQWALEAAASWMHERIVGSDGLGSIFPPMVWSVIAFKALGFESDDPVLVECMSALGRLVIEEGDRSRVQPCHSPVWDTALTLKALSEAGQPPDSHEVQRGCRWLMNQQILERGDWGRSNRAAPGGWCFEYKNPYYPDVDDTAMALLALGTQYRIMPEHLQSAAACSTEFDPDLEPMIGIACAFTLGTSWVRGMQNGDGGWGAFDRNNHLRPLCFVPFADHNAMIDPSTPDLTGRVLEALGMLGLRQGHKPIDRAVKYLRKTQEPDGAWTGRWGVNTIYGTWQAITGLRAVRVPPSDPCIERGVKWLLACQQECGGWGESPESYSNPTLRGRGPVTASQTAWALLGLMAAGLEEGPEVRRGVLFLLDRQRPDGNWDEPEFTGTGFPEVFYLRYHYYRTYFPLMALARYFRLTSLSLRDAGRQQDANPDLHEEPCDFPGR